MLNHSRFEKFVITFIVVVFSLVFGSAMYRAVTGESLTPPPRVISENNGSRIIEVFDSYGNSHIIVEHY